MLPLEGPVSPRYKNTFPKCSNLPYATFIPALFCPVSGLSLTVIYHSWAHYSAPTTPGEVFRTLWTKSDLSTLPRDWFTSKKALRRPKWATMSVFWGGAPDWYDRFFSSSGPSTALPQHQGSSSAHFGPSLSSQLFLGTDRGPKPSFCGRFWAPKKSVYLWGTNSSTYFRQEEYLRLSHRPEGSIYTWGACQKCKKSKTEALGCLRVALVGFLDHPPPPKNWPLEGAKMAKFKFWKNSHFCSSYISRSALPEKLSLSRKLGARFW